MKKILVVYNICGIESCNINIWKEHIYTIINQNYENFDLAISGCMIPENIQEELKNYLQTNTTLKIIFNFIEEILPVNITFNHTCMLSTQNTQYDGYLYVASDVKFTNRDIISNLTKTHFDNNSAITVAMVNIDSGIEYWFGENYLQKLTSTNLEIPVGKTLNMHAFLFDKEIYNNFNEKIIPDIFASYCTESVYSFICSSLNKKFIVNNTKDILLEHIGCLDGRSAGFKKEKTGWEHLFRCKDNVQNRLMTKEAFDVGFGYEELQNIFMHNKELYDENNQHKNPKILLDFLKKSIFLSNEEFDYNNIKHNNYNI